MEFEQACSEIDYILEHMNPNDLNKIPKEVVNFFKENKSILYKVKLDETKKLYEQELKDETKAFIKIINAKYLGEEKEKQDIIDIINSQDIIEEVSNTTTEMIVYKENILSKIFHKVLNFFRTK